VTYSYVDVEGFAGGFSCGATIAGLKLVGKRELPGGFGAPLMEANRAFLGDDWQTQAAPAEQWEPIRADVQVSNPPCSAFSGMTAGYEIHGMDSPINDCMWHAVRYAARVRPAVFVMESVSQAFTNGKALMKRLAQELNEKSGLAYRTTHVIQDNYSLGGVTKRKRYFLVLSQVPFGVEVPELKWLPTVGDALSDLRTLPHQWEPQSYNVPPTWWSHQLRSAMGLVDGHHVRTNKHVERLTELVTGLREAGEDPWLPGEAEEIIPERYYNKFGSLPEAWQYVSTGTGSVLTREKQLIERGWKTGGFSQTRHWDWSKPGRVINGAGPYMVWHPDMRQVTHREVARLMGFPDDWLIHPVKDDKALHSYWGKGTSVAPAEWICNWVRNSLDGNPGSVTGEPQSDGSHLINVSKHWQLVQHRLDSPIMPLPTVVPCSAPVRALQPRITKPEKTPVTRVKRQPPVERVSKPSRLASATSRIVKKHAGVNYENVPSSWPDGYFPLWHRCVGIPGKAYGRVTARVTPDREILDYFSHVHLTGGISILDPRYAMLRVLAKPGTYQITFQASDGNEYTHEHEVIDPLVLARGEQFRDGQLLWRRPGKYDTFIIKEKPYLKLPIEGTVLDLGAHIGTFTRDAIAKGAKRVIAYEPEPVNFTLLGLNTAWTGEQVVRYQVAMGDDTFKPNRTLYLSWADSAHGFGSGGNSFYSKASQRPVISVPVESFTTIVNQYQPITVKMDVKHAEDEVNWAVVGDTSIQHLALEADFTTVRDMINPPLERAGFRYLVPPKDSGWKRGVTIWTRKLNWKMKPSPLSINQ
jgi:FkbM family methyltransferase